jgi:hypothetical protein
MVFLLRRPSGARKAQISVKIVEASREMSCDLRRLF